MPNEQHEMPILPSRTYSCLLGVSYPVVLSLAVNGYGGRAISADGEPDLPTLCTVNPIYSQHVKNQIAVHSNVKLCPKVDTNEFSCLYRVYNQTFLSFIWPVFVQSQFFSHWYIIDA